jgi:hypothetical protein
MSKLLVSGIQLRKPNAKKKPPPTLALKPVEAWLKLGRVCSSQTYPTHKPQGVAGGPRGMVVVFLKDKKRNINTKKVVFFVTFWLKRLVINGQLGEMEKVTPTDPMPVGECLIQRVNPMFTHEFTNANPMPRKRKPPSATR